jgi:hypothetical protein
MGWEVAIIALEPVPTTGKQVWSFYYSGSNVCLAIELFTKNYNYFFQIVPKVSEPNTYK